MEMLQVGARGLLRVEGDLLVPVRVLDARSRWGKRDLLVMPVDGEGSKWVEEDRVRSMRTPAASPQGGGTVPVCA